MVSPKVPPAHAGKAKKKRVPKPKRQIYTAVTDIAGSKRNSERIRELDRLRQAELKQTLVATTKAKPTAVISAAESRFKKIKSQDASQTDYDKTKAALAKMQRFRTRKSPAPPPTARPGVRSANAVQPRPMREAINTAPSKPDTWTGGTIKPPLLTEAERQAKIALKSGLSKGSPKKAGKQVPQKGNPTTAKRVVMRSDTPKSEDVLDSRARVSGSVFSGKRGR